MLSNPAANYTEGGKQARCSPKWKSKAKPIPSLDAFPVAETERIPSPKGSKEGALILSQIPNRRQIPRRGLWQQSEISG